MKAAGKIMVVVGFLGANAAGFAGMASGADHSQLVHVGSLLFVAGILTYFVGWVRN